MRKPPTEWSPTPTQLRILAEMARYHAEHGEYPSQNKVGIAIGLSRKTVNDAMVALERNGAVTEQRTVPNQLTASGRKLLRKGAGK